MKEIMSTIIDSVYLCMCVYLESRENSMFFYILNILMVKQTDINHHAGPKRVSLAFPNMPEDLCKCVHMHGFLCVPGCTASIMCV